MRRIDAIALVVVVALTCRGEARAADWLYVVPNSDFDTGDVAPWVQVQGLSESIPEDLDASGCLNSRSVRVIPLTANANAAIAQCLAVPAATDLTVRVANRIESTSARLDVGYYSSSDCSTGLISGASVDATVSGSWQSLRTYGSPGGTASVLITLWAHTAPGAFFDEVRLANGDLIFNDGFEPGCIDRWASVP